MTNSLLLPSVKEQHFGWRYLLFQAIFLPRLLALAIHLAGWEISDAWVNFVYFSINAGVAVFSFRDFWKKSLLSFPRQLGKILLTCLLGFFVYRLLSLAVAMGIVTVDPTFSNVNDQSIAAMTQENFLLMAFGTVILAPIAEETFHRGGVFGIVYRYKPVAAYLLSSVIFSLVHINGYIGYVPPLTLLLCFVQYLPAGFCLAAAYRLSGSIFTPVFLHMAVNAIAILSVR